MTKLDCFQIERKNIVKLVRLVYCILEHMRSLIVFVGRKKNLFKCMFIYIFFLFVLSITFYIQVFCVCLRKTVTALSSNVKRKSVQIPKSKNLNKSNKKNRNN